MENRWSLKGKKALVTGASKGIGKAIAGELTSLGADVFSVSRNYKGSGGMKCDVTNADDRKRLYHELYAKWKSMDILINNAGTNTRKQIHEGSEKDYNELTELNMD